MRKGTAMEGFIRDDGTVRPIEHYDDTELRGKIQTNTDNISNLDSRVTELEEHGGGVEDPTKADKVVDATAGNLASLDEEGNLQDSGKSISDFSLSTHTHSEYAVVGHKHNGIQTNTTPQGEGPGDPGIAAINVRPYADGLQGCVNILLKKQGQQPKLLTIPYDALDYLSNLIAGPQEPTAGSNRYPTSGQVKAALDAVGQNPTQIIKMEGGIFKASVEARSSDSEGGMIRIALGGQGVTSEAWIKKSDLVNLSRALQSPLAPAAEGDRLITNGQVYDALSGKADKAPNASAGHLASLDANGNPQDSGYAISAGGGVYSGNRELVTGGQVCEFAELPIVQLEYTVSGTSSSNPLPSSVTAFDGIVEKINRYGGGSGYFLAVVSLFKEENGSTTSVGQSLVLLRYIVLGTQMTLKFMYGHSVINEMVCVVSGDPNAGTLVISQVTGSQITRNELDNYFESVLGS